MLGIICACSWVATVRQNKDLHGRYHPPPRIATARAHAKFCLGSGRELRQLNAMLSPGETVAAMTQCRYQGCFGLAVIPDTRFLFLCNGVIWRVNEDISLDRISLVQWQTVLGLCTLTLQVGCASRTA